MTDETEGRRGGSAPEQSGEPMASDGCDRAPLRVLFVCLGNICRSPTAEGVFRRHVKAAGLEERILIDSAGTGDYHIGEPPDQRACRAAWNRGYDLTDLRARQVRLKDFRDFDLILAMDGTNLRALRQICPAEHWHKLLLFTNFSSTGARMVPDPFFGEADGFETVLDLVEDASRGLLRALMERIDC